MNTLSRILYAARKRAADRRLGGHWVVTAWRGGQPEHKRVVLHHGNWDSCAQYMRKLDQFDGTMPRMERRTAR